MSACYESKDNGDSVEYWDNITVLRGVRESKLTAYSRGCVREDETNQYLGYEGRFTEKDWSKAGKILGENVDRPKAVEKKAVKYFRY